MTNRSGVVVVVGNPQPGSRTAGIARMVGQRLAEVADGNEPAMIDLAERAESLVRWNDPAVAPWRDLVLEASALVVASPTYKASFTGLVKLFLDTFGHDELGGVPCVAVMTGGSTDHHLAVQHHLVPVLVEIGASCPARGLYVAGAGLDDPHPVVEAWWATAGPVLARMLRA